MIVVPAKAGTHRDAARATEAWNPAFAGMTIIKGACEIQGASD
jgi:hypothetical protein